MTTTVTQQGVISNAARIRELLLINLFAVFSERDPGRRLKAIIANYTDDVTCSSPEVTTLGDLASTMECLSSRPRPAATTWRSYPMPDRRVVHAAERVHRPGVAN